MSSAYPPEDVRIMWILILIQRVLTLGSYVGVVLDEKEVGMRRNSDEMEKDKGRRRYRAVV
jgi:hypothetical protein